MKLEYLVGAFVGIFDGVLFAIMNWLDVDKAITFAVIVISVFVSSVIINKLNK